ncbi:MAG: DNA alkylation repair protein [Acidobacteriia bacterium]|nr:DNA alkylation repair protein [Terriglobia bacterium]
MIAPMPTRLEEIRAALRHYADSRKARDLQWFFKTGPGGYGEGDVFLGVSVPAVRKVARLYRDLVLEDAVELLSSPLHEERQLALFILTGWYERGDESLRRIIYRFYLRNAKHINNWDLVDCSAPHIVGRHLYRRSRAPLYRFAESRSVWKRRIAIMSTFYFVRQGDFIDTLALTDRLIHDPEDLIHKAAGWMIREIGNRDQQAAEAFLKERCRTMPRTMLRYATEKFPEETRLRYLRGEA